MCIWCEQEREGWNVDWSVGDYLLAVRDDIREEGGEEYDWMSIVEYCYECQLDRVEVEYT